MNAIKIAVYNRFETAISKPAFKS